MKTYLCALLTLIATSIYSSNHHFILSIEHDGSGITIEDESVWLVNQLQRNEVRKWSVDHTIVVSANNSPFSAHKYYLTNLDLDVCIEADLTLGPKQDSQYTLVITDIENGVVQACDGFGTTFTWDIEKSDLSRIAHWCQGQHLIVGANDTWPGTWISSCEFILINVEENRYARAG